MPTFPEQLPSSKSAVLFTFSSKLYFVYIFCLLFSDAIPIDSNNGFNPNIIYNATVIPTESYVTSVSLQPQRTASPTPMASTDATPLI